MVVPSPLPSSGVWGDPCAFASVSRFTENVRNLFGSVGFAVDFAAFLPILGVMILVRQETGG
jgi:hypothetical protein